MALLLAEEGSRLPLVLRCDIPGPRSRLELLIRNIHTKLSIGSVERIRRRVRKSVLGTELVFDLLELCRQFGNLRRIVGAATGLIHHLPDRLVSSLPFVALYIRDPVDADRVNEGVVLLYHRQSLRKGIAAGGVVAIADQNDQLSAVRLPP